MGFIRFFRVEYTLPSIDLPTLKPEFVANPSTLTFYEKATQLTTSIELLKAKVLCSNPLNPSKSRTRAKKDQRLRFFVTNPLKLNLNLAAENASFFCTNQPQFLLSLSPYYSII